MVESLETRSAPAPRRDQRFCAWISSARCLCSSHKLDVTECVWNIIGPFQGERPDSVLLLTI